MECADDDCCTDDPYDLAICMVKVMMDDERWSRFFAAAHAAVLSLPHRLRPSLTASEADLVDDELRMLLKRLGFDAEIV